MLLELGRLVGMRINEQITRRKTLSVFGGCSISLLAGCATPKSEGHRNGVDFHQLEVVLDIAAGTTHVVPTNNTETYNSIQWEDTGVLKLEADSEIEFMGINN